MEKAKREEEVRDVVEEPVEQEAQETKHKKTTVMEKRLEEWPKTNDKEFSKRMFVIFMYAFFCHIFETLIAEVFFAAHNAGIRIFELAVPVYTTIFAAVIVKGGVENVFKGKSSAKTSTRTTTVDNG